MPKTILHAIEYHARTRGERLALRFIRDDIDHPEELSYTGLQARIERFAAKLSAVGAAGERVLVACASGIDYVVALLACFRAQAIAVPYMPVRRRGLPSFEGIVADAAARFVVVETQADADALRALCQLELDIVIAASAACETGDSSGHHAQSEVCDAGPEESAIAYLQYTSGSTSRPKGVIVSHANLIANVGMIADAFAQDDHSAWMGWLPLYHDMGLVSTIMLPLSLGIPATFMAPMSFMQEPLNWLRAISRYRITTSGGPNFAYDLLVQAFDAQALAGIDLSSWSVAFNGAESVQAATIDAFAQHYAPYGFTVEAMKPCYGMAEATLIVSAVRQAQQHRLSLGPDGRQRVSVGKPVTPSVAWLRDAEGRLTCASGVVGEICIGGPSVTRGYWGVDDASSLFIPGSPAALLRTGDLGYFDDGELVICGRTKEMLIVRGRNFYPQDVEQAALALRPEVPLLACAAFADHGDTAGERAVLVAEVHRHVPAGDFPRLVRAIRLAVLEKLELHLDRVVLCRPRGIPLTTSGKTQRVGCRQALATGELPVVHDESFASDEAAPRSASGATAGEMLLALIERRLGRAIDERALDSTLLELGFDSLSLSRLSASLRSAASTRLPLSLLHDGANLRTIFEVLQPDVDAPDTEVPNGELSQGQQSLCVLQQAYGGSNRFVLCRAIAVNAIAAPSAAADLTSFIAGIAAPFELLLTRGSDCLAAHAFIVREHIVEGPELRTWLAAQSARPWQPARDGLIEIALVRTPAEPVLMLRAHHAVCDLVSLRLLLEALAHIVVGVKAPSSFGRPGRLAAREVARWQGDRAVKAQEAVARQFGQPVPFLELARTPSLRQHAGAAGRSASRVLPAGLQARIMGMCQRFATTEHVVLTAMSFRALAAVTGQRDLVVGLPVDTRESDEDFRTVDNFANLQPLRARVQAGGGIEDLVAQLKEQAVSLSSRRDYPFSQLVGSLQPERQAGRSPLFEVLLATHRAETRGEAALILAQDGVPFDLGGASVRSIECTVSHLPFDLRLDIVQGPDETIIKVDFRHDVVDASTVDRLLESFCSALQDGPSRELEAGDSAIQGPPAPAWPSIAAQILEQARCHADRTAIIDRDGAHSYGWLARRSAAVALRLSEVRTPPGSAVAVALPRGADLAAALLGTWRAGCLYVPLPDTFPPERKGTLVELSQSRIVIDREFMSALPDACDPPQDIGEALAYRIFTSGTTGRPKCVEITQHALANVVGSMRDLLQLTPQDCVAATTSIGFDIAGLELWMPLAIGASVAMLGQEEVMDGARLQSATERLGVTLLQGTPSWYSNLIQSGWAGHPRLQILCGGERLDWSLAGQLAQRGRALWNVYGPTETTIWSAAMRVEPSVGASGGVPLGAPLHDTCLHVLDESMTPVAAGEEGDLYIGGAGLAKGYFDQPELTTARFVRPQFLAGQRVYRTGDRAARAMDGALEFRGRLDRQVKISGHRLELAEVEAHLLSLPFVRQACAFTRVGSAGVLELCAALVGRYGDTERPSDVQIRRLLTPFAPDYAIPSRLRWFDVLPLNDNGKTCTLTLSRLLEDVAQPPEPAPALGQSLEGLVLGAWEKVLKRRIQDKDASFFDLGGTSLQLAEVRRALEDGLGRSVDMLDLLHARSARELARRLVSADAPLSAAPRLRRDDSASRRRRNLLNERAE